MGAERAGEGAERAGVGAGVVSERAWMGAGRAGVETERAGVGSERAWVGAGVATLRARTGAGMGTERARMGAGVGTKRPFYTLDSSCRGPFRVFLHYVSLHGLQLHRRSRSQLTDHLLRTQDTSSVAPRVYCTDAHLFLEGLIVLKVQPQIAHQLADL